MSNGQTLLVVLEGEQQARDWRISVWGVVGRAVLMLLAVAIVGGMLAFTAYRLWLGWQTGQWEGFWALTVDGGLFLFLPIVTLIPLFNQQRRLALALPALRQIAAVCEDALTPPVVPQPLALPTNSLPMGETAVGPLKRLTVARMGRNVALFPFFWIIFFLPFMFLLTGTTDFELGPILPFTFDPFAVGSPFEALFPLVMIGFGVLVFGGVFGFIFLRTLSGWGTMTPCADTEGIRWRAGRFGAERAIAWRDARSFSRINTVLLGGAGVYGAFNAAPGVVFLLDGPDASLIWTLAPTATERQYAASDHLCRLIISRTGLPLRDLTTFANEIAQARGNIQRLMMIRSFTKDATVVSPALQALAQTPQPRAPRLWRRVVPALIASLIPLLLFAAIFGYGGFVEHYQQSYYASLPQRLHSETPLFQDTLDTANYQWPVDAVTKQVHQGERFVNGAYELYGDDATQANWVWENSSNLFGDAAFEVTTSEHGTVASSTNDGIGLIFNIDNYGDTFSLFQIHADGTWELEPYHYDRSDPANSWGYADSGSSSAIRQGIGATNTLLVLKRGKDYLLYVNNHFVEAYYDRDGELASLGYVGLYMNDDAQTGDFSNLSVYPVQSSPALWYV